jgi:lysophospholipase L1-like esterase
MTPQHPWSRYVAIGDSFTEGIGDPEPRSPGGHRGWADRVAEVLSGQTEDFAYANLAIRGRLLQQILDEQIEPALALHPDLITVSMGGNDELADSRMWAPDRLHFSPVGHQTIARMVLRALNVENDLEPFAAEPLSRQSFRQARIDDIGWAREHFAPWILRRLRHQSSGDGVTAKRPTFGA